MSNTHKKHKSLREGQGKCFDNYLNNSFFRKFFKVLYRAFQKCEILLDTLLLPIDSCLPFSISQLKLVSDFKPKGVIHVGGHLGQELSIYKYLSLKYINFFEPQPELYLKLQKYCSGSKNVKCYPFGLGAKETYLPMHVETDESPNQSASASFLPPKEHLIDYKYVSFKSDPSTCFQIKTLDSFGLTHCDLLVIDVQGYEMEVLKGASTTLESVNYVICEFWQNEAYESVPSKEEIISYLEDKDFTLKLIKYDRSFGDMFFAKNKIDFSDD